MKKANARALFSRTGLHLALFGIFYIVYMSWVVPWGIEHNTLRGQHLIEGDKAYFQMTATLKPNLSTTLRGLNLAEVEHDINWQGDERQIFFGNIVISFDHEGHFRTLERLPQANGYSANVDLSTNAPQVD